MPTSAVNIRELKARLSYYLRLTKSGQVVEIRERGRPIGRIIPTVAPLEDRIDVMVRSGLVQWNRKRLPLWGYPISRLHSPMTQPLPGT